jgi:hypothetical protein
MAAEVHPGLPGIGKSGHDGEGVRVWSREGSGAAKAERRRYERQARIWPLS